LATRYAGLRHAAQSISGPIGKIVEGPGIAHKTDSAAEISDFSELTRIG
jgi:hypothetical protein